MVAALADFFFIAGLEGHEPAILNTPTNTLKPPPSSSDFPKKEDTIKEESSSPTASPTTPRQNGTHLHETIVINHDDNDDDGGSDTSPVLPKLDLTPFTPNSDTNSDYQQRNSTTFEDVIAKFASERDEFVLTLAPPTIPLTPRSTTPVRDLTVPEEEDDKVPELHNPTPDLARPSSPLRPRASIRHRLADLSRRASSRASRTGTLRRANTQGTLTPETPLTAVSRRSSTRSSNHYASVIPTPEPLLLPPGTHPLKRKLGPRLLGIWPTTAMTEEILERGNPPDFLPMFAFPNDIQVKLSDRRPRSTWHGFVYRIRIG
jgi:hypothetical protein